MELKDLHGSTVFLISMMVCAGHGHEREIFFPGVGGGVINVHTDTVDSAVHFIKMWCLFVVVLVALWLLAPSL